MPWPHGPMATAATAKLPGPSGDARPVQEELHDVKRIWSTNSAFAVQRKDGRIITWGSAAEGGDSSQVRSANQLGREQGS